MDFESVLKDGYVVAADDWLGVVVVWDGTTKFEMWRQRDENTWMCVDWFGTSVDSAFAAKQRARKWLANTYEKMEQFFGEAA